MSECQTHDSDPRSGTNFQPDHDSDERGFKPRREPLTGAISSLVDGSRTASDRRLDAVAHEAYWREHFYTCPYVSPGDRWTQFGPAFRHGWRARERYPNSAWEEIEAILEREWSATTTRTLPWQTARLAARDAWDRATRPRRRP